MDIKSVKVADLIPYQRNAKKHDQKQIDNVAESIRQFGMVQPIVVDKDNNIIIGHCRTLACQKIGIEEVPVVKLEDLTSEQANKLRLLDNKLNESDWDMELLAEDVPEIDWEGFDLDWELPEVEEELTEVTEDGMPEEVQTRSQKGDIWQLGNHRLMVGDSTTSDVEKLTEGEEMDLVITDPPYNVDYVGKTKDALTIINDEQEAGEFENFLTDAFEHLNLRAGGAFYIFHASRYQREFENALNNNNLQVRQQLIWNKNNFVMGRQDYQWKHEPIFYGWAEGAHYFIDDRSLVTVIEDQRPNIEAMKKDELKQLLEEIYADKTSTSVIYEKRPARSEEHPTMKPVKLIARLLKNSSKPDWKVLDLFGGSGSTLMACEQLNRKCYIIELDPHYADVIIQRWEDFTGRQAKKL